MGCNMTTPTREFRGVWIPANVWLDKRLTYFERCLLAEIDSLDGEERGCFASNEYLSDFFNERVRKIQDGISKLKKLGYIYEDGFDGRTRILRTKKPEDDKSLISTAAMQKDKTYKHNLARLPCQKSTSPHYIDNKEDNLPLDPPRKKEEKKEEGGGDFKEIKKILDLSKEYEFPFSPADINSCCKEFGCEAVGRTMHNYSKRSKNLKPLDIPNAWLYKNAKKQREYLDDRNNNAS